MVNPTPTSFYVDGTTYDEAEVVTNDHPSSSPGSAAPTSFYPDGNLYDYLSQESEVVALLKQLADTTTTNANAAASSATNAATSAAQAATAVQSAAGTATPIIDGTATVGTSPNWAHEDHVHPTDTSRASVTALALKADSTYVDTQDNALSASIASKAPTASPTFTGTPAAPTATVGTNTTQIATTAFVLANAGSGGRTKLAAASTYFVSTTGSNSNDGLTSGTAFLTPQKAFDVISGTLDLGGKTVTISLAAGTYSSGIDFSAGWVGGGAIIVTGAPSTLSVVGANCFQNNGVLPGIVTLQNVTLIVTVSGGSGISHTGVGTMNIGTGVNFGDMAGGDQVFAQGASAYVTCSSSYTISGGGRTHCFARNGAVVDLYNGGTGMTTTIAASVTFSLAFVSASALGFLQSISGTRTFSLGAFTVTGPRYSASTNAIVNTQGGGATFFPGTVAGTTATGAQYT